MNLNQLLAKFGSKDAPLVSATGNKQNPWRAETKDGLNIAFGKTKQQALQNLLDGIERRKQTNS